jgi:hypothetical protein
MAKKHLRSHTGLRGIAALMVAPVHMYRDDWLFENPSQKWLTKQWESRPQGR